MTDRKTGLAAIFIITVVLYMPIFEAAAVWDDTTLLQAAVLQGWWGPLPFSVNYFRPLGTVSLLLESRRSPRQWSAIRMSRSMPSNWRGPFGSPAHRSRRGALCSRTRLLCDRRMRGPIYLWSRTRCVQETPTRRGKSQLNAGCPGVAMAHSGVRKHRICWRSHVRAVPILMLGISARLDWLATGSWRAIRMTYGAVWPPLSPGRTPGRGRRGWCRRSGARRGKPC